MSRIIAIINQRGGVGKTTTAVHLTAALTQRRRRVLLCDLDPQGAAVSRMGINRTFHFPTLYQVFVDTIPPEKALLRTKHGHLLPSHKELAGISASWAGFPKREQPLNQVLEYLSPQYDYILLDCPPSLQLLTLYALRAADTFLVPVSCQYYALDGLSALLSTARLVKQHQNPSLQLEGFLFTLFDSRSNLSLQVAQEVKRHFPNQVWATVIPYDERLSNPLAVPRTSHSPGIQAYQALAQELLQQHKISRHRANG